MKVHKILLILGIFSFTGSSCKFNFAENCAIPTIKSSVPIESLISAPNTVIINNEPFILQTYLTIDNSSVIGKKYPRCLSANVSITTEFNNLKIPLTYKTQRLWIIHNREVWETNTENYSTQDRILVRGGPSNWGPKEFYNDELLNSSSDLVLKEDNEYYAVMQLKDNQEKSFFIKSENINISVLNM